MYVAQADRSTFQAVLIAKSFVTAHKRYCIAGWFSMSPLPRLLLWSYSSIDYCGVITPCHDKVLLSHFNTEKREKSHSLTLALTLTTQRKKRREKFHSLTLALTLTTQRKKKKGKIPFPDTSPKTTQRKKKEGRNPIP